MASRKAVPKRLVPWVACTTAASVLLGLGYLCGSRVEAPWQHAVENADQPVIATANVEEGTLEVQAADLSGTFTSGTVTDIAPRLAADTGFATVTRLRSDVGQRLSSGTPVGDVSGRPVLALELPFNLYRDLHHGDSGEDVLAVQSALVSLGYYRGVADGVFGPGTADAVSALYRSAGLSLPEPGDEAASAVASAAEALADFRRVSATAESDTVDQQELSRLRQNLTSAQRAAGPWLPMSEIWALPAPEVTVTELAAVGTELTAEGPALGQVRFGSSRVVARVGVADADSYTAGVSVIVSPKDGYEPVRGTVTAVSEFQPAEASQVTALPGYDIEITFEQAPPWPDETTAQVRAEANASTETGLLVPLIAIRGDNEHQYVTVVLDQQSQDDTEDVPVDVLLTTGGSSIVEGDLQVGDQVIVSGTR